MTELRDAEGVARGEDTSSPQLGTRTLDQRFWDSLLPQLLGVLVLLSVVAGGSIFRQTRVQQYSSEYVTSCENGAQLRILYPRTLPIRFDDPRGLPITLSMAPLAAPQQLALTVAPPLALVTAQGEWLVAPVRLTPDETVKTIYIQHEPVRRPMLGAALHPLLVEPPAEAGCALPAPSQRGAGSSLQLAIAAEDQARGYFYTLISFLSNPEVWGGMIVALVGGGLSLQLARQERRERLRQQRERQEREVREQEEQQRLQKERAQQARREREKEKREGVAQQIVEIQRALSENVEAGMVAFDQLALRLADDSAIEEELATLRKEVFSLSSMTKLLQLANGACRTGDHEQLVRTLSRVVQSFEPATLDPLHRRLYTAAACNLGRPADDPCAAADALLQLWEQEQYEYYELIVRGLQQLWESASRAAGGQLAAHLRERFSTGRKLRDILRDTRLRTLPTAADFESPLPRVPIYDGMIDPFAEQVAPYNVLLDPQQVAAVAPKLERHRLFHSATLLLRVKHVYDKSLLTHMLHRESRLFWPIVASYEPRAGNLLADQPFLERLCRALGEAWITLLKSVPTSDLLMGETASLLSGLLRWCYGGTTDGVAHALATSLPIYERGHRTEARVTPLHAEQLLVRRMAARPMPPLESSHYESALQNWLTLTPYGYRRNLFILIDEGLSTEQGACWIDDQEWASLARRGCLLKIVTQRPDYFRLSPGLSSVTAEWHPDDIVSALETVRTFPLAHEVFMPAQSRRWQDAFDGALVEEVVARHAEGSLGRAISLANALITDAQDGARRLTVEDVRQKLV